MKTLLLLTLLLGCMSVGMGQTSRMVKDTTFIQKITGNNGAVIVPSGSWITHRYDYRIMPTINGIAVNAWCNNYKGGWYSNYPYTVRFKYDRHIIQLWKGSTFIYAFTSTGDYSWINANYFKTILK